ncbi:hypothetical protein LINGRAHAP2_LOCUS6834, partial [Linum grandiflorum]
SNGERQRRGPERRRLKRATTAALSDDSSHLLRRNTATTEEGSTAGWGRWMGTEMEDVVTLVIHHGGTVVWPDEYVPQYIRGSTFQMHIFKKEVTYERLHQIARWEFQYESANRMFYLPHGQNMSDGMVEIFSEMSVSHRLLYSGIDGVITVYMTCIVNDEEFVGDNMTEGVRVENTRANGDEEVQRSVAEGGLIHLIDDSDRTTDPEFYEALNNLGILGLRRKFRSQRADGGEEVDQVYEEMEASTGPSNHVPVNTGPTPSETNSQPNEDDDEDIHDNLESLSNDSGQPNLKHLRFQLCNANAGNHQLQLSHLQVVNEYL